MLLSGRPTRCAERVRACVCVLLYVQYDGGIRFAELDDAPAKANLSSSTVWNNVALFGLSVHTQVLYGMYVAFMLEFGVSCINVGLPALIRCPCR